MNLKELQTSNTVLLCRPSNTTTNHSRQDADPIPAGGDYRQNGEDAYATRQQIALLSLDIFNLIDSFDTHADHGSNNVQPGSGKISASVDNHQHENEQAESSQPVLPPPDTISFTAFSTNRLMAVQISIRTQFQLPEIRLGGSLDIFVLQKQIGASISMFVNPDRQTDAVTTYN